jgi:L-ascorbate metabolism protein UlaG (beta-lactamase superfamily)
MAIGRDTTFTWLGHAAVEVRTPGGKVILFDPWMGNPNSPRPAETQQQLDLLLVTHGHADHMTDAVPLA